MKINIKEKFQLLEKLETLSEAVKENQEASNICARGIYEFKKGVNPGLLSSFVNTLNAYSWITEVASFIEDYQKFVSENMLGIKLESILTSLEESNHKATYEAAIKELNEIVPLTESEIKKEIYRLKSFSFIPAVRALVENFEKTEFAVTKTFEAEVERNHISPILVTESGYVFNLNGVNYEVNAELTEFKAFEGKVSSEYNYALRALSMFTTANDNEFVLETRNGYVRIVATEEGENKFFINENEFFGKEAIKTALNVTKVVDYFDNNTKAVIGFMYENADKFANVEIVKNVKALNENVKLSFIKLSDNTIYLNKVNLFEKKNELIQVTGDNYDEIAESFAKELKLDIAPVLESIKVNLKAVEFAKKVKDINIEAIVEDEEVIFTAIEEANEFYEGLTDGEKSDCKLSLSELERKEAVLESKKFKFLLETRNKFKSQEDLEGKEEVLKLVNQELAQAVKEMAAEIKKSMR